MATAALSCDVLVIGGGLGGITAALRAAQAGLDVVIVEAREVLGGTALFSGGGIHVWGATDWESYRPHCPRADPALARIVIETYPRYLRWLDATAAPGAFGTATLRGLTLARYQIGHSIAPRARRRWFDHMTRTLAVAGVRILLRSRAEFLLKDGDIVCGARLQTPDGTCNIAAAITILAAGGFQNDTALLQHHTGLPPANHVLRAVPENRGDGLRLALQAGAALSRDPGTLYGHLMPVVPHPPTWDDLLTPMVSSAFYAEYGIVLNCHGRRFVDEAAGELNGVTINAAARQPPGPLWIVLDARTRRSRARYPLSAAMIRYMELRNLRLLPSLRLNRGTPPCLAIDSLDVARRQGAQILRADTKTALADALSRTGADRGTVLESLQAIPDATSAAGPFWAIRVGVGVSMTYGGVAIDPDARALDAAGQPVAGLLAVPGTAGGVHHLHYAGALAACGTFGLVAADTAARDLGRHSAM